MEEEQAALGEQQEGPSGVESKTGQNSTALVLIVTPGGLDHGGGIGRMLGYMLEAWRHRADRPTVRVLDSRGPWHIAFSPLYFIRCLAIILFYAPRRPLLHIHVAGRGSTIRKIVVVHFGRLLRLPIVLHLHDYNYARSLQKFPKFIRLAARSMFRIAHRVVVLSKADRDLVVMGLGTESNHVEIVPNAVPAPIRGHSTTSRSGMPHILFLGNLSRRKGVHDLIEALATESLSCLEWHVTIAGGGGELSLFREQAMAADLLGRVSFPGWVDRNGAEALLASADILVLPSYDEGMAMSVLEGLSHGLCVVCTPVGAHMDVIENNVSGLFFKPGDVTELARVMARCIADPSLRARLGAGAARLFATKFNASRYPDRMKLIYEGAIEDNQGSQIAAI